MSLQLDIFSLPPVVEEEQIVPKPAPAIAYCIWRKFGDQPVHWIYTGEVTICPERLANLAENEQALPPDRFPNSQGLIEFHEDRLKLFQRLVDRYSHLATGDRAPEVYARERDRCLAQTAEIEQLVKGLKGENVSSQG